MKQYMYTLALFIITTLASSALLGQTDCDPNGNGNPNSNQDTEGTGEGHNTAAGDLAWELLLTPKCGENGIEVGRRDYDPAALCNNSSNLIPEAGYQDVKVAIIDSGVRPTSPGRFNGYPLFSYRVSPAGVVTEGVSFPHPHGTFSAGVINGLLEKYTDPTATSPDDRHEFYDYQVLNGDLKTSLAAVVAAIDHAVGNGVELISLSIGFVPTDCDGINWESPESPLNVAIENAENQGVIVVTSAGNNSNDLENDPQYPAAYSTSNLISVGALSCAGNIPAFFSNYSNNFVDVFTTGSYVQVYYDGCYRRITGTSFATSIVAGKAALHLTKNKNMNEVLCLLRSQTKPFTGDEQFSIYGIVDVPDLPEENICANGESYDPNGGSPADESGTGGYESEGAGGFGGGEKSATSSNRSISGKTLTVTASPNPFYDQLQLDIETADDSGAMVVLYDGQGRQVLNRRVFKPAVNLDLGHLPAGIYRLVVRNEASSQTRTIVKK